MKYDLGHLIQNTRRVAGPIQDDEALFLYAFIKCSGAKVILEVGGQTGYSARNFLAAVGPQGKVYTIDVNPTPVLGDNHFFIKSNIVNVDLKDIPRCDLVFYDAHAYKEQYEFHKKALQSKVIDEFTTIACHDTGLHSKKFVSWSVPHGNRWMHQSAERFLVEKLREDGYQAIHVHDDDASEPRHGLTILQMPKKLN
jgi:hypothetical protein